MKKYINHFHSLHAAQELLPFFRTSHSTSAKEITESYAMLYAARDILGIKHTDDIMCIIPGDGQKPRTGALCVFMTKWDCHSIDPKFDEEWYKALLEERKHRNYGPIERLQATKACIQDVNIDCNNKQALLLLPHSHARMEFCINSVKNYSKLDIVNMPCCIPVPDRYLEKKYVLNHRVVVYSDPDVWSPKRKVYIWQNI